MYSKHAPQDEILAQLRHLTDWGEIDPIRLRGHKVAVLFVGREANERREPAIEVVCGTEVHDKD